MPAQAVKDESERERILKEIQALGEVNFSGPERRPLR